MRLTAFWWWLACVLFQCYCITRPCCDSCCWAPVGTGVLPSVCLSVCLSASISLEPLDGSSRNSSCTSPVAVVRSSCGGVAIPGTDVYECLVGKLHKYIVDTALASSLILNTCAVPIYVYLFGKSSWLILMKFVMYVIRPPWALRVLL